METQNTPFLEIVESVLDNIDPNLMMPILSESSDIFYARPHTEYIKYTITSAAKQPTGMVCSSNGTTMHKMLSTLDCVKLIQIMENPSPMLVLDVTNIIKDAISDTNVEVEVHSKGTVRYGREGCALFVKHKTNTDMVYMHPRMKAALKKWVDAQRGGKPRKLSKRGRASKPAATKAKWVRTARKATVKGGRGKPATQKTVYRNSTTGELRVRKLVARPDGTRRVSYIKF